MTAGQLQHQSDEILAVNADLLDVYGAPVYFPIYLYGGKKLRAQQTYLVKFPAQLLKILPGLNDATHDLPSTDVDDVVIEDVSKPKKKVRKGGTTQIQDPILRSAVERHAVKVAIDYYKSLGAQDKDIVVLGKPYDVRLKLNEKERHVEVKGSSLAIDTVELTRNEVVHAQGTETTDLVVVDRIE